jgi:hypothetical protein
MAVTEYITITTSGSEISKKFYAILTGYTESHQKTQSIDENIEGDPLITNGGIIIRFSYILKLSYEMEDSTFGTKNDLIQMYDLNNPNAEPSDVLTLIDHYGISHTVKFEGPLELNPLTTMIDGEDSFFYTPIRLIEVIDE